MWFVSNENNKFALHRVAFNTFIKKMTCQTLLDMNQESVRSSFTIQSHNFTLAFHQGIICDQQHASLVLPN